MTFKVGDVVKLKSGGPDMTVDYVGEVEFPHGGKAPTVSCTWFVGKKLERNSFKPEVLALANSPN
ncbi:YodC family protein [Pseudothauera rhizosphaerae]|uniref:DUF2158 domain-containing protein n=1 Tax=Pseudothauera rhizosphaerae TaxID=2565932 RepID=A0A4S4ANV4_9RHOO|nr:DUF2158 domain-containing protein [Pseudothauera rhizosphaerae]THF60809.1 DUF2158 domain-containing protein [Pseudothauera rhizosphaerae]